MDEYSCADLKGRIDYGIVTIRDDEFKSVLRRLTYLGRLTDQSYVGAGEYNLCVVSSKVGRYLIALVRCLEQGNTEAQSVSSAMISDLDPWAVIVTGIAGGLPGSEACLGDVVVSSRIHDFSVEAALEGGGREFSVGGGPVHTRVRGAVANLPASIDDSWCQSINVEFPGVDLDDANFYGNSRWQEKTKNSLESSFPNGKSRSQRFITGGIASSDRLVKDTELAEVWEKIARHADAIEMESAGVYKACSQKEKPMIAIRGLSDIVGYKRSPAWTKFACESAAALTLAFLKSGPSSPVDVGWDDLDVSPAALHSAPDRGSTQERDVEELLEKSRRAYDNSRFTEAYQHISRAFELVPGYDQVIEQLVRVLGAQKRYGDCHAILSDYAPRNEPMSDRSRLVWGRHLIAQSQFREAADLLLACEDRAIYDVEYLTGSALLFQHKLDGDVLLLTEALDHLSRAVEHHPTHWWARVNLLLVRVLVARRTGRELPLESVSECAAALDFAANESPRLFSVWIYKLLLCAITNDQGGFAEAAAEAQRHLDASEVEQPKNMPRAMVARLELAWSHEEAVLEYYRGEFIGWLASLSG